MNECVFKGRLVSDPELRQTPSNISVTRFTIAVDKYAKAGEEKQADFIRCNAWRSTAEFIGKYFRKGQEILIRGELHNNDFEKDGIKYHTYEVTADRAEFCGSKNNNTPVNSGVADNTGNGSVEIGDLGEFEEILSDGDVPF